MAHTTDADIAKNNAPTSSEIEAPTTIPAFIGITEKALNGADSLSYKPWKITSMAEFRQFFGGAHTPQFTISVTNNEKEKKSLGSFQTIDECKFLHVIPPDTLFTLYYNMMLFYANGGGTCYIVSVGTYEEEKVIDEEKVTKALDALEREPEITLVVVPEAASNENGNRINSLVLSHCGKMKNRFAILDIQSNDPSDDSEDDVKKFRADIGENFLSYGAAYYPWLNTSVLSKEDIDWRVLALYHTDDVDFSPIIEACVPEEFRSRVNTALSDIKGERRTVTPTGLDGNGKEKTPAATSFCPTDEMVDMKNKLHKAMQHICPYYTDILNKVRYKLNQLPPSAAMAGIYTMTDNRRGVWKAPSNISMNCVNSLAKNIPYSELEGLNMPINGKAINAMRFFDREGVKVWGACTLDNNSLDWRYVNVRRKMIFIEEFVKNAAKAYEFAPNDETTWENVRSLIDSFLHSVWERDGLAGYTPDDAYEVHVGLGETMTEKDIQDGIMRIKLMVAVVRPQDFVETTFQQQMPKR